MAIPPISQLLVPLAFFSFGAGGVLSVARAAQIGSRILSGFLFAGCALLLVGVVTHWPDGFTFGPFPVYLGGLVPLVQQADALSLFFLCILGFVGAAVALYTPAYLDHLKGHYHQGIFWFSLFVLIASMAQVFLSLDAITFTVFWETMSLSSIVLILTDHASHKTKTAALIYLGATRVSTTLIFAGFLWLHALTGTWNFAGWQNVGPAGLIPLAIVFTGFCVKAGIWPFHLWLPYAYGEAPAPISALLSGVMSKVAIYGIIRVVLFNGTNFVELAYAAIVIGAISAFWGILFAQVETDIKRLLAYSSVENIGLIVLAIGLVQLAKAGSMPVVASIALAGCLFHILNHSIFKPLLFLAAGSVECGAHSRDLSKLGGLQRVMPFTAIAFFVGSMGISALPPLNGFASKWLVYQGLFNYSLASGAIFDRALGILMIGLLSMVGAMSIASFTKAFGFCFLGPINNHSVEKATEMPIGARVAQGILVAACALLGIGATQVVKWLTPVAVGIVPNYAVPVRLPEPQMLLALLVLMPLFYAVLTDFGRRNKKYFSTWECGFGSIPKRAVIGPLSFSRSLANLFGIVIQQHTVNEISGKNRRHFPDVIEVKGHQTLVVEQLLYGPIVHAFEALGKGLIKLQTGSIHVHLLYVFATLILLVILGSIR